MCAALSPDELEDIVLPSLLIFPIQAPTGKKISRKAIWKAELFQEAAYLSPYPQENHCKNTALI